jgi:hypothetical protein
VEVKMETLTKYIEKTKIKIEIKEDIKSNIKELQNSIKDDDEEEQIRARVYDMIKQFPEYEVELHSKDADIVVKDKGTKQVVAFFECKSVKNKDEMIEEYHINKKALHELIYYFLKAYKSNRDDIPTYLVVTNGRKWFVFNNAPFRDFAMDEKALESCGISDRILFKESSRDKIYENIGNYLATHEDVLKNFKDNCFYFSNPEDIYRFLSPDILLNKYNPSSGSALNKEFYDELLYIFGLKEVESNGKKKIVPNGVPNTFYSQISEKINDEEKILDLIIIWLNRILFLKLFEAKLIEFNDNKTFTFMDKAHIPNTTALKSLFFDALAVPENQRGSKAAKFGHVPYLNSSLFEEKEIEKEFPISDIQGDDEIPYYPKTVLHTYKSEKFIRKQGPTKILDYLFEFLSAYRFEGKGDPSSLISPAVLGLVFEKINGYKDGSYYTPTEITDFMAKTAIEKAILNKVKEQLGLDYSDFNKFKVMFPKLSEKEREKVIEIIRTLTILDPAVGSGHFLVSSLNVLLEIWYELGMINIPKKYEVKFENGDIKLYKYGKPFVYRRDSDEDDAKFQQEVFRAKKEIIENKLFGVDINPKAVEIARLRLWIELLKNAYYKPDGTMETLPNIDINIKVGNSLLAPVVDVNVGLFVEKRTIDEYKNLFKQYQETSDKQERDKIRKELEQMREEIAEKGRVLDEKYVYNNKLVWNIDFPHTIDENGQFKGFDVVIGNPPYISSWDMGEEHKNYYLKRFKSAVGHYDLYVLFFEMSLSLLKKGGLLCFITSNKFLSQSYGKGIREILLDNEILSVINFNVNIFESTVETCITIVQKRSPFNNSISLLSIDDELLLNNGSNIEYVLNNNNLFSEIKQNIWTLLPEKNFRLNVSDNDLVLYEKIMKQSILLDKICYIDTGVVVHSSKLSLKKDYFIKSSKERDSVAFLEGKNIFRWSIKGNSYLNYQPNLHHRPKMKELFEREKIIMRRIVGADGFYATYDSGKFYVENGVIIITLINNLTDLKYKQIKRYLTNEAISLSSQFDLKYVLANINSKLVRWFFTKFYFDGLHIYPEHIRKFPIRQISKDGQQAFVHLVDQILTIKQSNPDADVSSLESQIDNLVYQLYVLEPDEIAIIENEINKIENSKKSE